MAGRDLVFFQVLKATLGSGDVCLQAWSVLQGSALRTFVVLFGRLEERLFVAFFLEIQKGR